MLSSSPRLNDLLSGGEQSVSAWASRVSLDLRGVRTEWVSTGRQAPGEKPEALVFCPAGADSPARWSLELPGGASGTEEPGQCGWSGALEVMNASEPAAGLAFRRCFVEFRQIAVRVFAVRGVAGAFFVGITDACLRRKAARRLCAGLARELSGDCGLRGFCLAFPRKPDMPAGEEPFGREAAESLLALFASVSRVAARGGAEGADHG